MVFDELIPSRLISGGQSIPYKYIVIKGDKPDKLKWEHYLINTRSGKDVNRNLTVPLKLKGLGNYNVHFVSRRSIILIALVIIKL